jgi:hypothetical protein
MYGIKTLAMELIPRMSEEAINKWDKGGYTALMTSEEAIFLIKNCGHVVIKWKE